MQYYTPSTFRRQHNFSGYYSLHQVAIFPTPGTYSLHQAPTCIPYTRHLFTTQARSKLNFSGQAKSTCTVHIMCAKRAVARGSGGIPPMILKKLLDVLRSILDLVHHAKVHCKNA